MMAERRQYVILRCPRCEVEVDIYGEVVGAWCAQDASVLRIVSQTEWGGVGTVDRRRPPRATAPSNRNAPARSPPESRRR